MYVAHDVNTGKIGSCVFQQSHPAVMCVTSGQHQEKPWWGVNATSPEMHSGSGCGQAKDGASMA